MEEKTSVPTDDEEILAEFIANLEKRGPGIVDDFVERYPALADEFRGLRLALGQIRLGPYRDALRLLFQPLQPDPLGRKNMGHELQRSLVRAAGSADGVQNFVVRPFIVGELAAQIVSKIHETASVAGSLRLHQCNRSPCRWQSCNDPFTFRD